MLGALKTKLIANLTDSLIGDPDLLGYFFNSFLEHIPTGRLPIQFSEPPFEGGQAGAGKLSQVFYRSLGVKV